jgi:hypothetical protein
MIIVIRIMTIRMIVTMIITIIIMIIIYIHTGWKTYFC